MPKFIFYWTNEIEGNSVIEAENLAEATIFLKEMTVHELDLDITGEDFQIDEGYEIEDGQ